MIDDRIARHNSRVLSVAQALGGASPPIIVSLGGIVGMALSPDKGLATVPVSLLQLGIALGTLPAAYVMRRLGRRNGYFIGSLIAVLGGAVAAAGIAFGSFLVFCLGTLTSGFYTSYVQSYRFAATDSASPGFKARAISWVMAGGLAAGIIGPQTVIWTRDLIPSAMFAASFLSQAALALLTIVPVALLKPAPVPMDAPRSAGRPLIEIMRQPKFLVAVAAGVVSYGLMSFMMTAAPVAMVDCGHSVGTAALGIQWHVLAMFGPSFATGRLIGRYGKERIVAAGLVLIAAAAATGLSGLSVGHFWLALVLLGVGWNFAFIGATTLVTDCYRPEERAKVQAANDFLVFGTVAIASFSSGQLLSLGGWGSVNWLVFPPVLLVLGLILWQSRRTHPAPA
jgi:predicted MFS family arabinose efflux permease